MYIYPQGEEGGERRHWQVGFSFTTSGGSPWMDSGQAAAGWISPSPTSHANEMERTRMHDAGAAIKRIHAGAGQVGRGTHLVRRCVKKHKQQEQLAAASCRQAEQPGEY